MFRKHSMIVIILYCLSGLGSCIITLMSYKYTALLVAIRNFDYLLNFGQGIMTFAILGLESQYVFLPMVQWFEKASSIWAAPECIYTEAEGKEGKRLHFTLKCVQMLAKKKLQIFTGDVKQIGRKKEQLPKISDALKGHASYVPEAAEHVMLNFCQY